jgi:hypothetical protein
MKDHIDILNYEGAVWWGIVGKGMSMKKTKEIENQLSSGVETKILLTTANNLGERDFHIAKILEIRTHENKWYPVNETDLIPKYYDGEAVSTWLKLSNIKTEDKTIMTKFRLQSNPNQNLYHSFKGRTSVMYIVDFFLQLW